MVGNFGVKGKGGAGRPEEELLFRAAAVFAPPAGVPGGLDADRLLALAAAHGLTPLLHRHLEEAGYRGCPEGLRERLRESMRGRTVRAFALVSELAALIRAFAAAGIPAVPFKGPSLALAAYGSFGMREAVDLDFLLPKALVKAAGDLLLARGYVPERDLPPAEEAAQFRVFCDRKYLLPARGLAVELHWDVVPRFFCFSLPFEAVRPRLRSFTVAGESTRVLGTEDLLLALSVHGAKHCFIRLAWIADVSRVLATAGPIDWPALFSATRGGAAGSGCSSSRCTWRRSGSARRCRRSPGRRSRPTARCRRWRGTCARGSSRGRRGSSGRRSCTCGCASARGTGSSTRCSSR